jgi:hypothetical protein
MLIIPQAWLDELTNTYLNWIPPEPMLPVSKSLTTAEVQFNLIKASISMMGFVCQYVELTPT